LYQHPSRQRHLSAILLDLASGTIAGVSENTQVIYTTHSPLFVGLDRFQQIRVLRKTTIDGGAAKATKLRKADMNAVAAELWKATGASSAKFTAATLRARLHALMTPWMNEGFFADTVVLVEGEDDRAAILGVAGSLGYDFDSLGITVVPCFGKTNLDRPLLIFRQLGIPVYVVWDGDRSNRDAKPEANRLLLRLVDMPEQDWPDFVGAHSACFASNLEKTLENELGPDLFTKLLTETREALGIPKKSHALKNAVAIRRIIDGAAAEGKVSESLQSIVENIVSLNTPQALTC